MTDLCRTFSKRSSPQFIIHATNIYLFQAMTSHQSGISCKTCRRRGRKCDRTLPRCMSCHGRDVECEGYPLRWIGLTAKGKRVVRTYNGPVSREREAKVLEGQDHARQYGSSSGDVTLRRPTWKMPATLIPLDGLQVFIKCCKNRFIL